MAKKSDYMVTFDKPVTYEGKDYKEVDLSGMENLTMDDLCNLNRDHLKETGMVISNPEADPLYSIMVAHKVTGLPLEFFKGLPIREGNRVKNTILLFFQ